MPTVPAESIYRSCVAMRVKRPDGVYVDLEPGQDIPPGVVESWNNPALWAKDTRRYFERKDGRPIDPLMRGAPYQPPRALTTEDLERMANPAPCSAPPFIKANPANIGPGDGQASAARDPSETEMDAPPAPAAPVDPKAIEMLRAKSRSELFKAAKAVGLKINANDSNDAIAKALAEM